MIVVVKSANFFGLYYTAFFASLATGYFYSTLAGLNSFIDDSLVPLNLQSETFSRQYGLSSCFIRVLHPIS